MLKISIVVMIVMHTQRKRVCPIVCFIGSGFVSLFLFNDLDSETTQKVNCGSKNIVMCPNKIQKHKKMMTNRNNLIIQM